MIYRQMNEFVVFEQGINPTRAQKKYDITNINYYDQASFDYDYEKRNDFEPNNSAGTLLDTDTLKEGDVIISNYVNLATVVGKTNAGKVLSLNFTKVNFKNNKLDQNYFIFLFNAYSDVKRQKERELQGSGAILKIPIKALERLKIPLVSLEEQKKIGNAYYQMLKLKKQLSQYTELIETFSQALLEKHLKE